MCASSPYMASDTASKHDVAVDTSQSTDVASTCIKHRTYTGQLTHVYTCQAPRTFPLYNVACSITNVLHLKAVAEISLSLLHFKQIVTRDKSTSKYSAMSIMDSFVCFI